MKYRAFPVLIVGLLASILAGCIQQTSSGQQQVRATVPPLFSSVLATPEAQHLNASNITWSENSHSKKAEPNYEIVFPADKVNTIYITIDPDDWQKMETDLANLIKIMAQKFGVPPQIIPEGGFGKIVGGVVVDLINRQVEGSDGNAPSVPNPLWVPATIEFGGKRWDHVGIRFKGNSSLIFAWLQGNRKLSFKLDFDEFEDEYPQIDDQRFYGFKQLNLNSNYQDRSFLRQVVAADLFRDVGLVSAEAAFYAVIIDYGEGPVYFGLYTLVEEVDDTVIETQLGNDDGNLYKPEGAGASFAAGSFTTADFAKKSNEKEADWRDIEALFAALHDDSRSTDAGVWRTQLEAVFDVDAFLRWLAANTVMQNWDAYGQMTHNYFLYHNPDTEQLTWIPWDNTAVFKNEHDPLSLSLSEVTDDWPLISFLINDPVYRARYSDLVAEFATSSFTPTTMTARYRAYQALIAPYVALETEPYTFLDSAVDFEEGVNALIEHASERQRAVRAYLAQ